MINPNTAILISLLNVSAKVAFFQRINGPTPITNTSGNIKGTNTALKYGGPTEIFPAFNASKK